MFAGMPTWMHFISAFYSLNMFSSFGVMKATDVQIINSAILYYMRMRTDAKMSYDRSTAGRPIVSRLDACYPTGKCNRPTVGRSLGDSRPNGKLCGR